MSKNEMDLGSFYVDGESKVEDSPKSLSWRLDPDASLSDWTIVVTTTVVQEEPAASSSKSTSYHVHKNIVGAGPRGSQYFLRLFKTNGLEESNTSTSRLELENSAAIAFPDMLDFMYRYAYESEEVKVEANPETAVALRHLANYFGVPTLFESVNNYIRKDMNKDNIHVYLREALQYQDDKIVQATMAAAVKSWLHVMVSEDGTQKKPSKYMDLLPQSQKFEVMELALLESVKESKRFRRVSDRWESQHISNGKEPYSFPSFGNQSRAGFTVSATHDGEVRELPLFYFV
jgi:hypothetical protein